MSRVEPRAGRHAQATAAQVAASSSIWPALLDSAALAANNDLDAGAGAPKSNWAEARAAEHFVQFYESDAFLLDAVTDFIATAIQAGGVGIVVATAAHHAGLRARFRAAGLAQTSASGGERYLAIDAAALLSRFRSGDTLDVARFQDVIGDIVAQAGAGGRRVHIFGEMVALLAAAGEHAAAVQLERMWNELQRTLSFSLFCAYSMQQFDGDATAQLLHAVCAEHTHVIPAESYTELATNIERLRAITMLQQKASQLEVEIGERKRAEEQLRAALVAEQAARREAEAALRVRDEFLAIAAHELRTPLTGLSGHAQLVLRKLKRDGQLEPERIIQALEVIAGQTDKLSRLLNQLLDISRLEAGKLAIERQPTDLVILVEQAVAAAQARDERHTIVCTAPAALVASVDPLRLEQVLVNLLDNASKHSPDGGRIDVRLAQSASATLDVSVRDYGSGIPPETRAQIFERFFQAHAHGHRNGLGLGLYISRQIVELHGGDIHADFPADGGTCFVVRLPIEPA